MRQADRRRVRAAVLGSPVSHSLSPDLHMAAYSALGLTWWRYEAIECDEAALPGFLDGCGPDWAGLSLTMPLKRAVLPLLDRAEPLVAEVGAANTVLLAAAQRLGYNTDVPGMVAALEAHGAGAGEPAGQRGGPALIIGGGATACSALAALRDLGERSVTAVVRDMSRADGLRRAADRLGVSVAFRPAERESFAGQRLIISTVPASAAEALAPMLEGLVPAPRIVFDVVYHPWPTRLAAIASGSGATVIGGLDLLVHQAARQVELMTGRPAPIGQMWRAVRAGGHEAKDRPDAIGLAKRAGPGAARPAVKRRTTSATSHLVSQVAPGGTLWLTGSSPGNPSRLPAMTRPATLRLTGDHAISWRGDWQAGRPSGRPVMAGRWRWRALAGQSSGRRVAVAVRADAGAAAAGLGGPACTPCGASCHVRRPCGWVGKAEQAAKQVAEQAQLGRREMPSKRLKPWPARRQTRR